jgi:hypothetical protein
MSLYTFNGTPINKLIDLANYDNTIEMINIRDGIKCFKFVMHLLEKQKKYNHDSIFSIIYNDIDEPTKKNISNYVKYLLL